MVLACYNMDNAALHVFPSHIHPAQRAKTIIIWQSTDCTNSTRSQDTACKTPKALASAKDSLHVHTEHSRQVILLGSSGRGLPFNILTQQRPCWAGCHQAGHIYLVERPLRPEPWPRVTASMFAHGPKSSPVSTSTKRPATGAV